MEVIECEGRQGFKEWQSSWNRPRHSDCIGETLRDREDI
jgi:hypothetical protein